MEINVKKTYTIELSEEEYKLVAAALMRKLKGVKVKQAHHLYMKLAQATEMKEENHEDPARVSHM